MKIKTHLELKFKTQQTMVLTMAMQQALYVLQLPVTDLVQWVQLQIEQNPLLQFDDSSSDDTPTELDFELQGFEVLDHLDETFVQGLFPDETFEETASLENLIPSSISLYDYMMEQARGALDDPRHLAHAEQIIGNLDEKGFLGDFDADPQILKIVQSFDPPGIAARNLQESLLIQLKVQKKENSLAYLLISDHFDDLLRCRLSFLAKKFHLTISDIQASLKKDVSSLDFHPASRFQTATSAPIIPDVMIEQRDTHFHIRINEAPLPRFTLSPPSIAHLNNHYAEGKWMEKILSRRREILTKIVQFLLVKHREFFTGTTQSLEPLAIQELAKELQLHESTVARAVKDKYVACPRGIFSLKYFFPHVSSKNEDGTAISHVESKQLLLKLILQEDKNKPLSDDALARAMSKAGIPCARRTISKYRKILNIPPASHRRKESDQK